VRKKQSSFFAYFFEDVFEADGREFAFTRAYIEEKDDGLI